MESPFLTPQEYLEIETRAAFKSAYWNGRMYPMDQEGPRGVDSPERHSAIVSSLTAALAERLPNSQWRVVPGDDHDVSVFFKSELIVAIEVISPSTERADRGEKFHRCRKIESIKEYVLIEQESPRVETYLRTGDGSWLYQAIDGLQSSVRIAGVDLRIDEFTADPGA